MEVYRGDIFYVEDNYRTEGSEQRPGRPALVVSNNTGNHFSSMVSVVWLTTAEKKPLPTHCEVVSGVPSTAICEQVVTISQNRLGNYIRTATESEMKEVDKCLMIALGLNPDVTCNEEDNSQIDELKKQKEMAEDDVAFLKIENAQLQKENCKLKEKLQESPTLPPDIAEEVAGLKAQIEVLERYNERLLDRLIG